MCEWVEEACLRGSSGIAILLQPHGKALVDLGIACEEVQENRARNLCDPGTGNGGDGHWPPITEQVKSTGKVVASLPVGNDALVRLITSCACGGAACHLHESFQQNVHGFTCWPACTVLAEEALISVITLDLCLFGDLADIDSRDALE